MGPQLAPTITIQVAPTTITVGQSATLTWSSSNASTCTASGGWSGTQNGSGTQSVTPTAAGPVMYTLMCVAPTGSAYSGGGGGSASQSATVTVNAATAFAVKNLVTDTAGGGGAVVDPNLTNPWGIVFGTGKPVWTANNGSQTSTLYDGNGTKLALTVALPKDTGGNDFDGTGIIVNATTDFVVTSTTKTGPAVFIFSGEDGMLAGWNAGTAAVATYTDTGGASYKGLAIASVGTANYLYATDFHNNKIDVFNGTWQKQTISATSFPFVDPQLPAGYAPFGIQTLPTGASGASQIYVTYAKQQGPDNHDNTNGAGLGVVDIYDTSGVFVKRLISPGAALNAPWGLALAPADFGTLSKTLLVGNFGDGKINGYDPASGAFMGSVTTAGGAAFAVPGLWGIAFGNDVQNQPHNTLYFAAGTNNEVNGEYGRIDVPAP
jgi:uncharacterized protein (TIGR03118 family)